MSGHEHLSEDVLIDALYGIAGPEAEAHTRRCPDCATRLSEREQKRAIACETGEVSSEFLTAQRRKIYQRLSQDPSEAAQPRSGMRLVWAPALAAACALVVGIFVYHPRPDTRPAAGVKVAVEAAVEANDTQLFTDVFSMEQSLEPNASAPVRALFEDQQ